MDVDKFNNYMLDICEKLEEIYKEIPEVYSQNYEYFSENRKLIRDNNNIRLYFIVVCVISMLVGFSIGFFII